MSSFDVFRITQEESLGAMKKTKLTRTLLAACSIVALSAVMYGCVHSGGEPPPPPPPKLTLAVVASGVPVMPGTYSVDDALAAAFADAPEELSGREYQMGAMETVGGVDLTCGVGPCSVTVNDDGTVTVAGTIWTADYMPPPPPPTNKEVRDEAMLVLAAIGPDSVRPDGMFDEAGRISAPFTIAGGVVTDATPDDMDDDFSEEDTDFWTDDRTGSDVRWTFSYLERDDGEGVQDSILNYTDQADPTDVAYQTHFASDGAGAELDGIDTITDGAGGAPNVINFNEPMISALAMAIDVAGFPSGDQQMFTFEDDLDGTTETDERTQEGSFYGVPGTFLCDAGSCTVVTDMDGNIASATGTWTFTPDEVEGGADPHMAIGALPDPDYMDFGFWWQKKTTNDDGELEYANPLLRRGREKLRRREQRRQHGVVYRCVERRVRDEGFRSGDRGGDSE